MRNLPNFVTSKNQLLLVKDEATRNYRGSRTSWYDKKGNLVVNNVFIGNRGFLLDDAVVSYMRARFYSPTLKRFISRDPLSGTSTDYISQNAYLFAGNDPINNFDPTGLKTTVTGKKTTFFSNDDGCAFFPSDLEIEDYEYINAGTIIGLMGNTGNSTGKHLHFSFYPSFGADAVDPKDFIALYGGYQKFSDSRLETTQLFGHTNFAAESEYYDFHNGWDLAPEKLEDKAEYSMVGIRAIKSGFAKKESGFNGGWGNTVKVFYEVGSWSRYSHLFF